MANEQEQGSKSQAIRDFLAENPDATISHVVEALAARGIQVSPPFVVLIRSQLESKAEDAPEAESVTISVSFPEDRPPPVPKKKAPRKKPAERSDPGDVKAIFEVIVEMTDAFCEAYLHGEYADLCRKLAAALARKRPSPLTRGKWETWACGIIRTIGWVNFLDDPSQEPHMKLTFIDKAFGVAESTGQGKSKTIRNLLKIRQFDPKWTLPSQLDDNPMVWMVSVNGFIMDMRHATRELQETAFEKGLIPYIPGESESSQ